MSAEHCIQKLQREKLKAEGKGEIKEAAAICNYIGQELMKLGKYEEARLSHCEELEYCSILRDELGKAVANRKIGECYAELNNFKKALHHQTLFLEIAVKEKSLVEEQRAWATLGRTYFIKYQQEVGENLSEDITANSLNHAEKAFHKALKLAESIKSEVSPKEYEEMRARLLLNLGLVYEQRSDLNKCSDIIRYAIFLAKKNNLYEDLHRCQYSLATVYQRCKQYELALRILDEAISSAKVLRDKTYICEALSTKANVLFHLRDFVAAKSYLKKAYKLHSPIASDHEKIAKHLKVAICLCECQQKLSNLSDPGSRKPLLEKIADGLASLDCYKLSVEYYSLTLSCLEEISAPASEKATIYYSIAQTYIDDGNYAEALKYLGKEIECNIEKPVEQIKTMWKVADVEEMLEKSSNAENTLVKALTLAEAFMDQKSIYFSLKRLYSFYEFHKDSSKMDQIRKRLENFDDVESDMEEEEITETEELFDEVDVSELLSGSSDSENESSVVKRFKRSSKLEGKRNELGETVLHRACIAGKLNLVKQLVENGHEVNVRDNCGWTPLHEACNHGYYEIVEYLLSKGANINDRGGTGCRGVTPLMDAASCGNLDVVELLISKGASVSCKSDSGQTVLDELIKWRKRCGNELDPGMRYQSEKLEAHLKELLKPTDCNSASVSAEEEECETVVDSVEDSLESTKYRSSCTSEKRNYSSSSSDEAEVYSNPHLDWDKENDFNDPKNVKSDYEAVLSSIRHGTKYSKTSSQIVSQEPLQAALIDEPVNNEWLIHDTKRKNKVQKTRKRHKPLGKNLRKTNRTLDQYLSGGGSDSDSIRSSPIAFDDRSSYNISADESSVGDAPFSSSKNAAAEPGVFSVRVRVNDKIIFIPVLDESSTIGWLANEASNRFQNLVGKKPLLQLMKNDGALLFPSDLVKIVLRNNEEIATSITSWEQTPLLEVYKQNCLKNNVMTCEPVEKRLQPFETTSELNFSDVCLPTSQLMVVFKSLDSYHRLSYLNMSNNDIDSVFDHFKSCIPLFRELVSLNLSCSGLTSSFIKGIAKCLKQSSVPLMPKLQRLCLSYNSFGPESASYFAPILQVFPLQVLKLSSCDIIEEFFTDEAFCNSLSNASQLNELDVSSNDLNEKGVLRLLANLPRNSLSKLDLSRTISDQESLMEHICNYVSQSMPNLLEITLEACFLKDSDILSLSQCIKYCPRLSVINVSSNPGLSGAVFLKLIETSHAFNIPFTRLVAIDSCTWNEETSRDFCKAFQTRLLRNVIFEPVAQSFYEQMFSIWFDVWSPRSVSCNEVFCEFSVDHFVTYRL